MKDIQINGKNLIIKSLKIKYLIENSSCFLEKFDNLLLEYLSKTAKSEVEYYKSLKHLYIKDVFVWENFIKQYSCDGNLKIWKSTRFGWDASLVGFMRGTSFRNKKRPEHAKLMSIKMKGIDRGDSFRQKKKIQNKDIAFKKTFLRNKDVDIDFNNEKEVLLAYSLYLSDFRKSHEHKIKKINNFIKTDKYKEDIFVSFLEKYKDICIDESNCVEIFTEMMSIISSIAIKNNPNMGSTKFFIKGFIKTSYCLNKTIISFRSSWELKTIEFLENNKIYYEYEPFYIQKKDKKYYLPDFLFNFEGQKILLEIKGFVRGASGKKNEELKKEAALEFCKKNNIKFIYLNNRLTDINQLNLK